MPEKGREEKDMKILRRVPDECLFVDRFHEYVDAHEGLDERIAVYGNRRFIGYGDKRILDIIRGDYEDDYLGYDYETLEELRKITGKRWNVKTIHGYSQGDWNVLYYAVDEVSEDELNEFECLYMGKYSEYELIEDGDDPYSVVVPHSIEWEGKDKICEYLDLDPGDTRVEIDDGFTKQYKYKELR